jgi:hypothetical protein
MYPSFHAGGVSPKLVPTPKPKKQIRRKNNNVVQYDLCASLAMPAIGNYFPAECIIHDSKYCLVRDSHDCAVSQDYNQSRDDTYVNFTLEGWNNAYEQAHHLDEDTRVVHIPTDDLENDVPMVDFEGDNWRGDHVSTTDHYHGDYILAFAVPAEVECHFGDGKRYDRVLIEWCCGPHRPARTTLAEVMPL